MTDPFEHLYKKEEVESWGKLQCYLRLSLPESQPSIRVSRAAVCWTQGFRFGVELLGWKRRIALAQPLCHAARRGSMGNNLRLAQDWGR